MTRLRITGLALVAAFALSGIASGSAAAAIRCAVVVVPNTGQFKTHQKCLKMEVDATEREYILVIAGGKIIKGVEECAVVAVVGTGTYKDANCTEAEGGGEYIKVIKPTEGGGGGGGPQFLVGSSITFGTANVTTKNLGNFTLKPSVSGEPEPVCTGMSAPTIIYSGASGLSETEIRFTGCTVAKHEKCDALSAGGTPGNITVLAADELVYTGTKAEAEKEEGPLGDLFTPVGGASTPFVTLTFLALETGACPSTAVEVAVNGSVIGSVEPAPGTMSTQGMLTFPTKAIKEGWQWLSKGKVDAVTAGLKFAGGSATQIGLADLELESGEEWGTLTA